MPKHFIHNHYVPEWYQKKFILSQNNTRPLYYLDLKPRIFIDSKGKQHTDTSLKKKGLSQCFAQDNLYTTSFGGIKSTTIEDTFFGKIDDSAPNAVEYFAGFNHTAINYDAFQNMILHMSTQKLRTPKGLGFLREQAKTADRNIILQLMLKLRGIYCAIWTECIWQIADASRSETKFIISDHPVTVYNRRYGPRSEWCRGFNDPDISLYGTHTLYPLCLDKILILTNLSWVRNPSRKSELKIRPNPNPFRSAMFDYTQIQIQRNLTDEEVRQMNFIIKSRAYRFIAAAKEEWLYPDKYITKSQWNTYGKGYLFMPDPRGVTFTTETLWGNHDGIDGSVDAYGRRPWEADYMRESESQNNFNSSRRFQAEFARIFGPYRRGRALSFGQLDPEKDSDEFHNYHLSLAPTRKKTA